ncbi:MAG: NADH-quinone oxidoreductase subunit J [Verrucomicrobia bacterium]|nr:MAG: NADH-quinone oxidoreductase subunit J [Verrucomicrobiota bacterium]
MQDFLFYLFSAITLGGALLVVTSRNAVNSAVFLIVTFLGMAALFVLLESYFLAVLQVLVYAGAVVVLFLFIIMLLDVKGGRRRRLGGMSAFAAAIAGLLLVSGVVTLFTGIGERMTPATATGVGAQLHSFGYALFTTHLLPMQVTGFLLLVAMIGVIVLSKRLTAPTAPRGAAPAAGENKGTSA